MGSATDFTNLHAASYWTLSCSVDSEASLVSTSLDSAGRHKSLGRVFVWMKPSNWLMYFLNLVSSRVFSRSSNFRAKLSFFWMRSSLDFAKDCLFSSFSALTLTCCCWIASFSNYAFFFACSSSLLSLLSALFRCIVISPIILLNRCSIFFGSCLPCGSCSCFFGLWVSTFGFSASASSTFNASFSCSSDLSFSLWTYPLVGDSPSSLRK